MFVFPVASLAFALASSLTMGAAMDPNSHQIVIPDVTLVDQNGQKFHFYPKMVEGHVFGINTIFTSCPTVCPLIGLKISSLEKQLGQNSGTFQMISISVDSVTDTPAKLHEWAKPFHAGPEWKLLTGAHQDVDRVLKAFGLYAPEKESHSFEMVVGGGVAGGGVAWTRTTALLPARELAGVIQARLKGLR